MKNLDQYILESLKGYKPGAIKPKEQLIEDCSGYFEDQEVDVDEIENLDTSNVTNMDSMFSDATFNQTGLDLSSWDVSNVTNMDSMFANCKSLKVLDLSSWDVSNVKTIRCMFNGCGHLEFLDVSGWDTSNVTNMYSMFYGCNSLKSLDLSSWDTSKVTSMSSMFYDCRNLIDIRFGPDWFNSKGMVSLELLYCGKNNRYKLSDETYESMLTMYDRKKAGLNPIKITLNRKHNIPEGWIDKIKERGYYINIR